MPIPIDIESPADPRIEPYLQIRERDVVGRDRAFIAEGEVVLAAAIGSGRHPLTSLLIAQSRREGLAWLLEQLGAETPVYLARQDVLDAIAGFHLHRGILAFGRQAEPAPLEAMLAGLPSRALVVVLFGIANHDNMGGVFRNAAAFGADAVILDPTSCDPYYRKAIRVSVGACLTAPFTRARPEDDILTSLAAHGFEVAALSPSGSTPIKAMARPQRIALVLGPEGPGLPEAVLSRASTVRIEMGGELDSLNVATASGIALHHLSTPHG